MINVYFVNETLNSSWPLLKCLKWLLFQNNY